MKLIIIKIGTKVLSSDDGTLDVKFIRHAVDQIVKLRKNGIKVVLVTSGAVNAGKSLMPSKKIKDKAVQKQIFAAIGQVKLMRVYFDFFEKYNYHCAQVLATKEDFRDKHHYLNMQRCFKGLLLDNVVPIVNENDVVATTELLFTDNDELAGLIAKQLNADSLIILTGTEGILDNNKKTIPEVNISNIKNIKGYINLNKSAIGRGGMTSKFAIAKELSEKGISVYIVNGKNKNVILDVVNKKNTGTRFMPKNLS